MKNQNTRLLYQYWLSRRAGRSAPQRADINPTDVQHLLSDSFILQADAGRMPSYRLAGTRAGALFGQELRNQPFLYLWAPIHRNSLSSALDIVISDALCVLIGWKGRTNDGHSITGETLLAPLTLTDNGRIERILGIVTTHTTPFWLGRSPVAELDLTTMRIMDPQRDESGGLATGQIHAQSLADAPIGTGQRKSADVIHMRSTRQVAHLAVFEGGRRD